MPTRNIWHIIWTVYLDKHNKEGPTKRIFQFLHSITFTSIWLGWPVSSAVLVLLESTPLSDTLRNQMGSFQFWYRPLSTMKRRVNECLMLSYLRELRKIKNKFLFMWKKIACSECMLSLRLWLAISKKYLFGSQWLLERNVGSARATTCC